MTFKFLSQPVCKDELSYLSTSILLNILYRDKEMLREIDGQELTGLILNFLFILNRDLIKTR